MCWCRESGHCGETESDRVLHSGRSKRMLPVDSDLYRKQPSREAFTWNYGDNAIALGLNGGSHSRTFTAAGTDLVANMWPHRGGRRRCTDTLVRGIEVYPAVQAEPAGALESCAPWEADLVATGYEDAIGHDISWVINGAETVSGPELQRTFLGLPDVDQTVELNLSVTSPYGCQADSTVMAVVRQTPVAKLNISSCRVCRNGNCSDGFKHACRRGYIGLGRRTCE